MLTVRSLQRHLNLEVLVRAAPGPAWVGAAAFGAWKFLVGAGVPVVGGIALLSFLLALVVRFRQMAWTKAQALVVLDRAAGAGGLALALAEVPSQPWQPELTSRLAQARLPRRDLVRPFAASLGAGGFVLAAVLIPRPVTLMAPLQVAAQSHVEDAETKAETLASEKPLDPALQAELERLAQEAETGRFDASDWAALDAVDEALSQSAAQRATELAQAEAAAQQLAEALDANAGAEAEQRAREALEAALMGLGEPGAKGAGTQKAEGSGREGEAKPGQGKPGRAAHARELAQALGQRRQAMQKCSGEGTSEAQGGKPGTGGRGTEPGTAGWGTEPGTPGSESEPGTGAPSRGPGAAPVTFGPQHPIDSDQLLDEGLDRRGTGDDPAELEGVRSATPSPGEVGPGGTLGAPTASPGGVVPDSAPLAPRHRDLVRKYFDRRPAGDPAP